MTIGRCCDSPVRSNDKRWVKLFSKGFCLLLLQRWLFHTNPLSASRFGIRIRSELFWSDLHIDIHVLDRGLINVLVLCLRLWCLVNDKPGLKLLKRASFTLIWYARRLSWWSFQMHFGARVWLGSCLANPCFLLALLFESSKVRSAFLCWHWPGFVYSPRCGHSLILGWHGIGITLDLLVIVVILKIVVILHQGSRLPAIANNLRWIFSFNMFLYRAINQVFSFPRRLYWLAMQRHKVLAVIRSNNRGSLGPLTTADRCTQILVTSSYTRKFRVVSLIVITLSLTRLVLMKEGNRIFFSMALLSGTLGSWVRFWDGKGWQLASIFRLGRCTIAASAQVVMSDWRRMIAHDLVVSLLQYFWPNF